MIHQLIGIIVIYMFRRMIMNTTDRIMDTAIKTIISGLVSVVSSTVNLTTNKNKDTENNDELIKDFELINLEK